MSTVAIESEVVVNRPADLSMRVVTVFIDFLNNLFLHIEGYEYHADERETKILIADKFNDVLDSVGKKPSLVTDLKSIVKQEVAIDDRAGQSHHKRYFGKEYKTYVFNTALLIHCISSNQWESRHLAFLVGMGITGMEDEIRKHGKFLDVTVPVPVGEPVKLVTASRGRVWSTPVTVQLAIEESIVRSIIKSELLTKFSIRFKVNGEDMPGC